MFFYEQIVKFLYFSKLEFHLRYVVCIILKNCLCELCLGGVHMRIRKQEIGECNIIGVRVEQRRKELGMKQKELLTALQIEGIEMNASGLSKL